MDNLEKAYELLDQIKESNDSKLIKQNALKAFELSNKCYEAAIILSKLSDDFSEKEEILIKCLNNIDVEAIKYELANLYFEYGLFKKALDLYLLSNNYGLSKYRIMVLYTMFEDERIEEFYKNNTDINNKIDYTRMSFTYMLYKFKKHDLKEVQNIFNEINKNNKEIINVILSNNKEDDDNFNEALKIVKNNAIIINSSPMIVKYLESLC